MNHWKARMAGRYPNLWRASGECWAERDEIVESQASEEEIQRRLREIEVRYGYERNTDD